MINPNPEQDLKMQKIAQKILDNVDQKDNWKHNDYKENFGFIITTLMIISIVLTLIRIIQECNKKKISNFGADEKYNYFGNEIKNLSLKRSWFTKMMTKKAIRKNLTKEQYKEYGVLLMNAILTTGENLTQDEVITLVEVSNV